MSRAESQAATELASTSTLEPNESALTGLEVAYGREGEVLTRRLSMGSTTSHALLTPTPLADPALDPATAWFVERSRGAVPTSDVRPRGRIRTVDLFSGSGGLSLGTRWAIEALGRKPSTLLAVDVDEPALDVHQYNHGPRRTFLGSVRDLLTPELFSGAPEPTDLDPAAVLTKDGEWIESLGSADVIFGGPPCQGHSNLNNVTRRIDDRNQLYFWMALAAHAFRAKVVIIENVASVKADAGDVVGATMRAFDRMGFDVILDDVLSADRFGVSQTRKRHFMIAVRRDAASDLAPSMADWLRGVSIPTPSVLDVIGDLQDATSEEEYDAPSVLSEENQHRIDYLFDHDLHDLPDAIRPESHRDGHTYPSVYGRMHADRPAGTLSTGFLTPGRGRYVHPTRRRTMTLHEGARVQGFPDDFRFVGASGKVPTRTAIARMIGDAVPPPLAFHVALAALASVHPDAFGGD